MPLPYTNMVCLTVSYNLNAQRASIYLDGQKVASGRVSLPLYTIPDPDNYLGQSQWYGRGDPYYQGVLDEFRIYSGIESDLQIAIDAAAGPNNIVTNAGTFISIQFNNSTNVTRERRVLARCPGKLFIADQRGHRHGAGHYLFFGQHECARL